MVTKLYRIWNTHCQHLIWEMKYIFFKLFVGIIFELSCRGGEGIVQDFKEKHAQFIDSTHQAWRGFKTTKCLTFPKPPSGLVWSSVKIHEYFSFAHPEEQIVAVEKCSTATYMYGSNLWDLESPGANMFINAWRTGLKLARSVPKEVRTMFLSWKERRHFQFDLLSICMQQSEFKVFLAETCFGY